MGIEIERKFLVRGDGWQEAPATYYCQGYLNRDPARTIRIRIAGEQAYLTVKGLTTGASRVEFEYEIPTDDARAMLAMSDGPWIEKYRRRVRFQGSLWEVDEFLGSNSGLTVAEIELEHEDQVFERPPWLGTEVTGDPRYYNANLASNPYTMWARGTTNSLQDPK